MEADRQRITLRIKQIETEIQNVGPLGPYVGGPELRENEARVHSLEVERAIAVGHWHVLATLSAVIALFLGVDRLGVKGILRQIVGWGTLLGSTLAFVFVQFYLFRQPDQDTTWALPFLDAGIAISLITLAIFVAAQGFRHSIEQKKTATN